MKYKEIKYLPLSVMNSSGTSSTLQVISSFNESKDISSPLDRVVPLPTIQSLSTIQLRVPSRSKKNSYPFILMEKKDKIKPPSNITESFTDLSEKRIGGNFLKIKKLNNNSTFKNGSDLNSLKKTNHTSHKSYLAQLNDYKNLLSKVKLPFRTEGVNSSFKNTRGLETISVMLTKPGIIKKPLCLMKTNNILKEQIEKKYKSIDKSQSLMRLRWIAKYKNDKNRSKSVASRGLSISKKQKYRKVSLAGKSIKSESCNTFMNKKSNSYKSLLTINKLNIFHKEGHTISEEPIRLVPKLKVKCLKSLSFAVNDIAFSIPTIYL